MTVQLTEMKLEQIANDKTIDWLLEKDNPSVRYFPLTKLLNKNENDKEALETKDDIMKIGIVPAIFDKLQGSAEIITQNLSLFDRLISPMKSALKKSI